MRGRLITGILLVAVGAVWIGQGLGLLRGSSFMVDDVRWAVAGIAALAFGIVLAISAWRSSRSRAP
jgi:hypothetical protein